MFKESQYKNNFFIIPCYCYEYIGKLSYYTGLQKMGLYLLLKSYGSFPE